MRRNFKKTLLEWKDHPLRMPLIVRGARQVGKTFIVEAFGKESFKNFVRINFEEAPQYLACFESMDPQLILSQIELISNQKIVPGETLLFLDEIQQCPQALKALRYFKEQVPTLHLIAAGSLLEFAIQDEDFSFPVGRVQFAKLYPLSFEEYLDACGDELLKEKLATYDLANPPPTAIHEHLLERVRQYFIVGGMPASILAYTTTKSYLEVQYVQKALLNAFEADFGKYAKRAQYRHLKKILEVAPRLIGDHVKYSRIDPELSNPTREMKQALEMLRLAGLVHTVFAASGGALPLLSHIRETIFKLIFLDIGLLSQKMSIDPNWPHLMTGSLTEQFVGQEFLATSDSRLDAHLFFWTREKGLSEVDYLIPHQGVVYPIEVKAGKSGKLKSLFQFIQEKRVPFGIKISQNPLGIEQRVLSIPLYLTAHTERLIDNAILKEF